MFAPHIRRAALAPALTVPQGLVGYWPLDLASLDFVNGKAFDRSGYGNHGTLNGLTTASLVRGQIKQALNFDGSTSYITIPTAPILEVVFPMSLCVWFKGTAFGGRLFDNANPGTGNGAFFLDTVSSKLRSCGPSSCVSGNTTLSTSRWYLGGYVSPSSGVRNFFLNGIADGGGSPGYTAQNNTIAIGSDPTGATKFSGVIQQVRLYARLLTGQDWLSIYTAGLSGRA